MADKLRVGVVGASGYAGGELCRLLLSHECVQEILPTSRGSDAFERVHPNLLGCGLEFISLPELIETAASLDAVFLCTPPGEAMESAKLFLQLGVKVIDLGPDFRFPTASQYTSVYGIPHVASELLENAVYGVTELNRGKIRSAQLIANPGCYAITCILGLLPLIKTGFIDFSKEIHISAINGTTGAGGSPTRDTSHATVSNGVLPYSLEGHRHGPELEYQLASIADQPVEVVFTAAHGSFARGIHELITVSAKIEYAKKLSRESLIEFYIKYYGKGTDGEHFVVVNQFKRSGVKNAKEYHLYPNVARVTGSNFCHIGLDYQSEHGVIKIVAVSDNLVKGAAGSAIQNMNLMFNLPETTGLRHYGL